MSNRFIDIACSGIRELKPYQPGKPIEELEREYGVKDIIKLASNENPLGPGPKVVEAIEKVLTDIWLYPDANAFDLKQILAEMHGIDPSRITVGNGSNDVLELISRVFLQPGTNAVFAKHSFAVYPLTTMAAGADLNVTPVFPEGRENAYVIDFDAMLKAINLDTRVVFIANPNNPTGTWSDGNTLKQFIAQVPDNIIVVIDEAYAEYAAGTSDFPDATLWLDEFPNLVVTRTFSKAYGLAGLRIGYGLSSVDVADLVNRIRQPFNVNVAAQVAATAALADKEHLKKSVAVNTSGLKQLADGFERIGLEYIPSIGNFICVKVGSNASDIYEGLLRNGIIVRPVDNYALPEFLRVTVGLEEQNQRLLETLQKLI